MFQMARSDGPETTRVSCTLQSGTQSCSTVSDKYHETFSAAVKLESLAGDLVAVHGGYEPARRQSSSRDLLLIRALQRPTKDGFAGGILQGVAQMGNENPQRS